MVRQTTYRHFSDLRRTFASADYLPSGYTIFNIAGNKYRLIVEIDYSLEWVDIKALWTHAEYSQTKNLNDLRRGTL